MKTIYMGLHGAMPPGAHIDGVSEGQAALNRLGEELDCRVFDWPAATTLAEKPTASSKPWNELGYRPTIAVKYLVTEIKKTTGNVRLRLFGWSTGAIKLCDVARSLRLCPELPPEKRFVDLCFTFDPLWSLEIFKFAPTIPSNVRRWYCVRQNINGDRPPLSLPTENRFWQGMKLERESTTTEYHEINLATGKKVGNPGFELPTNTAFQFPVNHTQVPVVAFDAALGVLQS